MANRLLGQTSPYLLQHADNPVDWWPWGPAAFAEAKARNVPILLSIGYAACHWCHVMAHESFENPAIAEVMNRLFINIKVDREERPDVDQIYMAALHAFGEQGGWPLTMFLTPEGKPFWGGTYFPPTSRYGRPGFPDVLTSIARTFAEDNDRVAHNGEAITRHLASLAAPAGKGTLDEALPLLAARRLSDIFDPVHGGLRGAPKFPQAPVMALLLAEARRARDSHLGAIACHSLARMSEGGIYDHLGGGFARYSVDERWLVPHFEKMLYDNGQLLSLLADAYRMTGEALFRERIEETIGWLDREMLLAEGAYAASLDADTNGEEGLTYVWSEAEIDRLLGQGAAAFKAAYDVTPEGNFEGHNILNRLNRQAADADERNCHRNDRARLLEERNQRPQPGQDDKILTDWNALAIRGLVDAGLALGRADWIARAASVYRSILSLMSGPDGRLAHASRAGAFTRPGFASDHAGLARAAIALHQATDDDAYLADAARLLAVLDADYAAGDGLYFMTSTSADDLLIRPKPVIDEALPGHHGEIAMASVMLHLLTGEQRHLDRADAIFAAVAPSISKNILGVASILTAFGARLAMESIVIVGLAGSARDALAAAARTHHPAAALLVMGDTTGLRPDHPACGKTALDGHPAAYLCRGQTCAAPITDPAALA